MDLAEILDFIQKNIINGTYSLENDDINMGEIFENEVPAFNDLVIKDVNLQLDLPTSITVGGSADILDYKDVDIELTVKYGGKNEHHEDIITYSLHVILPPNNIGNLLYSFGNNLIENIPIPDEIPLPQFDFSDFVISIIPVKQRVILTVKAQSDWIIPLGISNLPLSEIELSLRREPSKESSLPKYSGIFGGKLELGDIIIAINCQIPGKFEIKTTIPTLNLSALLQDLCGPTAIQNSPIPLNFLDLEIRNLSFAIGIKDGRFYFKISGETNFGNAEFFVGQVKADSAEESTKQIEEESADEQEVSDQITPAPPPSSKTKWAFAVGFSPPESFKFSDINPLLSALDDLKLTNIDLILSSSEKITQKQLSTIFIGRKVDIKRGLNIFVTIDLVDMSIDKLLGIEKLGLTGQIGISPFNLLLGISIEGTINIFNIIELNNINFEIDLKKSDLSFALRAQTALQLERDLLILTMAANFNLKEHMLTLAGTMEGVWNQPFGFKGVTIEDVALELGIKFSTTPIPLPVIGFAGTLKVGDFYGSGAININSINPLQCMLKIRFNKLYLIDVITMFCDPVSINEFPLEFLEILNGIGFENVNIYIVPTTVYIGELRYDPGFIIKGFMRFLDWTALINLRLDWTKGIKIYGKFDTIEIPNLFSIRGAGSSPNPIVDIALIQGENPHFYVSGTVEILGISLVTDISIDARGFQFIVGGKILNIFDATLLVEGGNLHSANDFRIRAIIHNNFINTLRNGLISAIDLFANETNDAYSVLLNEIDVAQAAVADFGRQITNLTEQIRQERDQVTRDLTNAQNDVNQKRNALAHEQGLLDAMRAVIQAERDVANRDLNNAIQDVNNAQEVVNGIDSQISSLNNRINRLNSEISSARSERDDCGFLDIGCVLHWTGVIAAKRAEVTACYLDIGIKEGLRLAAWSFLETVKAILSGIQALVVTTPIELDPRMVILIAAREAANGLLLIAEGTLAVITALVENFPIDLDPRILAIKAVEAGAIITLEGAELALMTFQAGTNLLLDAAKNIIITGFDLIFNIKGIWFDAKLGVVSGGIIKLILDVEFMQQSRKIMFEFDFKDLLGSFSRLGQQIITGNFNDSSQTEIIDIEAIVIKLPILEIPDVLEIPVVEEPPTVEEPPVVEEPPAVEEPPTVEEPPAVEEPPTVEEPPVVEEPPAVEEPPTVIEKPPETEIRVAAYYFSLKNYSYNDLCWLLAEKILKYNGYMASIEDTKKKAEQVFRFSCTYDELCWLNAEMDLIIRKELIIPHQTEVNKPIIQNR